MTLYPVPMLTNGATHPALHRTLKDCSSGPW
ncbi:hypothetical protein SUDANB145_07193 (plasmid) [Streptomyces sp. enrichment culture]